MVPTNSTLKVGELCEYALSFPVSVKRRPSKETNVNSEESARENEVIEYIQQQSSMH